MNILYKISHKIKNYFLYVIVFLSGFLYKCSSFEQNRHIMLCIIQARMNSKRLPGKMLKIIEGKTLIERVYNQVKKAKSIKKIIIATSNMNSDNVLVNFCKKKKFKIFRGSLNNVALRIYNLLQKQNFEYFIRISGDSPLIDFNLIEKMCKHVAKNNYDIITNVMNRTFPKGQSIEIIKVKTYKNFFKKIVKKADKEHVTPFFYRNKKKLKIKSIKLNNNFNKFNYCIDNEKDLNRISEILKSFNNHVPTIKHLIPKAYKI